MQIFVLANGTSTIEIGPTATAAELKQVLADRTGVNAREQVLTLGGHPLVDEKSLSENGVEPLSTLSLTVGLLGGTNKVLFIILVCNNFYLTSKLSHCYF